MRHSTHSRRNFLVRLACVKHAASVQSEPESNSPVEKSSSCTQASRPESVELKALFPIRSSLVKEPPAAVQQRREAFMHPSASPVKHFFHLFQNIFRYAPISPFLTVCYNIVFFAARKLLRGALPVPLPLLTRRSSQKNWHASRGKNQIPGEGHFPAPPR